MTIRQMAAAQRTQESTVSKTDSATGGHRHMPGEIDGMCLNCYGEHKHDKFDLPDSVSTQLKDPVLKSLKDGYGWNDTDYFSPIVKNYIVTVDPEKRMAASQTMQKVWQDEVDRIGQYIHSKDPNWTTWGQKFDLSILDDYKQGIDVKG